MQSMMLICLSLCLWMLFPANIPKRGTCIGVTWTLSSLPFLYYFYLFMLYCKASIPIWRKNEMLGCARKLPFIETHFMPEISFPNCSMCCTVKLLIAHHSNAISIIYYCGGISFRLFQIISWQNTRD